jgi:transposase-like protein
VDYQCGGCGRVFNAFTGTSLQGTHRRPAQLLLLLHGVAQGTPTAQMARELGCDRNELLALRHRLPEHVRLHLDRNPLDDDEVEADEMYQNAGEKRGCARRP